MSLCSYKKMLKPNGILIAEVDTGGPQKVEGFAEDFEIFRAKFEHTLFFVAHGTAWVSGSIVFAFCSDSIHPMRAPIDWAAFRAKAMPLHFYNPAVHFAAFALPSLYLRATKQVCGGEPGIESCVGLSYFVMIAWLQSLLLFAFVSTARIFVCACVSRPARRCFLTIFRLCLSPGAHAPTTPARADLGGRDAELVCARSRRATQAAGRSRRRDSGTRARGGATRQGSARGKARELGRRRGTADAAAPKAAARKK